MSRLGLRKPLRTAGFDLVKTPGGRIVPVRPLKLRAVAPYSPIRVPFDIPIDICTSFLGLPFAAPGWNPLTATLRELTADESLTYEDSTMWRVHQSFQPSNLRELLLPSATTGLDPLSELPVDRKLFRYVWNIDRAAYRAALDERRRSTNYYFGPLPPEEGRREFDRLKAVHTLVWSGRFDPDHGDPITGYFVSSGERFRFVVGSGNHRVAALAEAGRTTVSVRPHSHPFVVSHEQLDRWTPSRGGIFPPATAEALLQHFLTSDGTDVRKLIE